MSFIGQIPIKDDFFANDGNISTTWKSFFNDLQRLLGTKRNQQNVDWTPTLSANIFSASGTITGKYTRKDNLVFFGVIITPTSGTTTSVLNTNWINNLPFKTEGAWFGRCFDLNNNDLGAVCLPSGFNNCYLPSWTALSTVINVSGIYVTSE